MNRRDVIKYSAGGSALLVGAGAGAFIWLDRKFNPKTALNYPFPDTAQAQTVDLAPTPSCDEAEAVTINQTEGPFYKPSTPERSVLREADIVGVPLIVEGFVTDTQCRPIAGAVIDLWSCDGEGVYDNDGFRLRGHQFTDLNGYYRFSTVRPVAYKAGFAWRTPHIHVKVQGRNTSLLTTQLYFPDEPLNRRDSIFDKALLLGMSSSERGNDGLVARYDFVLV